MKRLLPVANADQPWVLLDVAFFRACRGVTANVIAYGRALVFSDNNGKGLSAGRVFSRTDFSLMCIATSYLDTRKCVLYFYLAT